ncbi:hypothetical protein VPH159E362A_0044 [Vibrio phage 159E36-2a]
MKTYDIGTFVGTRGQYEKLISDGTTVCYFVEVEFDKNQNYEQAVVHIDDIAMRSTADHTGLLQGAINIASGITVTGDSDRVRVILPGESKFTLKCPITNKNINQKFKKPKIQDR